jgi:XTP/dITP diphosphohydrolase
MTRLVIATRSADKLREIRQILGSEIDPERIVSLQDLGVEPDPLEDTLEEFDTFQENALAKARYFATRTGLPTLADDSGLCVDALAGAPGVHSKRFSNRPDLRGIALDQANNQLLLERLRRVPAERRSAYYACVVALVTPGEQERTFEGTCHGFIVDEPQGAGGFGYDPLFRPAGESLTFGQLPPARKNELSHRAAAVRAARDAVRDTLDPQSRSR